VKFTTVAAEAFRSVCVAKFNKDGTEHKLENGEITLQLRYCLKQARFIFSLGSLNAAPPLAAGHRRRVQPPGAHANSINWKMN
jgi:hypothetical protein